VYLLKRHLLEEIKENGGGSEFKYDIFDIRTFVNATVYPTQHNN
jgi:hypothetical protein